MKLLDLQNGETKVWEEKGYLLPKYDREELKKKTKENPTWVHFGAGNISVHFRLQNYRIC